MRDTSLRRGRGDASRRGRRSPCASSAALAGTTDGSVPTFTDFSRAMNEPGCDNARLFRVWLVACGQWQPLGWDHAPPDATVLEPAWEGVFSAEEADRFIEGFNRHMLRHGASRWAVRQPVRVRYEGDLVPGQKLS
jgi:hypothetical protein